MPSKGVLEAGPGRGPSYIRVTTPANLELALEGLVRKVLKEQPKQEDIYSFAADYFEQLVEIRDKAENPDLGVLDICPGRSEAEAKDLVKLATSFAKPAFLGVGLGAELCRVVDVQQGGAHEGESGGLAAISGAEGEPTVYEADPIAQEVVEELQESKREESENLPSKVEGESDAKSDEVLHESDSKSSEQEKDGELDPTVGEGLTEPEAAIQELLPQNVVDAEVIENTSVAEDLKSEDTVQDGVTTATEDQQLEDIGTEDKVTQEAVANDPGKISDHTSEDVKNITETSVQAAGSDVTQNTVTDVIENIEEKNSLDTVQEDVTETETQRSEPMTDVNDGITDIQQAHHDDIFGEQLSQDVQIPDADSLLEHDEEPKEPETDLSESMPSEPSEPLGTTAEPMDTILTEPAVESASEDNPPEVEATENPSNPSNTVESLTADIPLAENSVPETTGEKPSEPSNDEEVVPDDQSPTEVSTDAAEVTEDKSSEQDSALEKTTEENPPMETPSSEDALPEPDPQGTIQTDSPIETAEPVEATPENIPPSGIPSEPSTASDIPKEDSSPEVLTETPTTTTETTIPNSSTSVEVPVEETVQDPPTTAEAEDIPTETDGLETSVNDVLPSAPLEQDDRSPSQDFITAETESNPEITKERDIMKEFLEREQEFSTMSNTNQSLELVDVHLEDPPSDLSLTAEPTTGLVGGTVIENSVLDEEPSSDSVGGLIGGVTLLESKTHSSLLTEATTELVENSVPDEVPSEDSLGENKNGGLVGGWVIPDVDEVVKEEPIMASLIGGISHTLEENTVSEEKHDGAAESSTTPVGEAPVTTAHSMEVSNEPENMAQAEVVEQAIDDVLQEVTETTQTAELISDPEKLDPVEEIEKIEEPLVKDDSGSNHSRSSKESESLDEENPFISAEVKTLVQAQEPTVIETDSQEDEADVIIPLNADIGTIQETDEGKWDEQLTLARAAIIIQRNFRKYLQRKKNNESFTAKESTSTDSSLSSSATKIRQDSRTIESSRSDATNSFNEPKLIKAKAKSMSTVPDSEVWGALEQEMEETGNTPLNSHRQKLRREDAVQITNTASEESLTSSPEKQRLLGTGELHDLIVPEEN